MTVAVRLATDSGSLRCKLDWATSAPLMRGISFAGNPSTSFFTADSAVGVALALESKDVPELVLDGLAELEAELVLDGLLLTVPAEMGAVAEAISSVEAVHAERRTTAATADAAKGSDLRARQSAVCGVRAKLELIITISLASGGDALDRDQFTHWWPRNCS